METTRRTTAHKRTETEKAPPFAGLVRRLMLERGLGLREFCRAAEVDPSFFSKVLSGKRSPPWDEAALRRMAGALGLAEPALIAAAGRIPGEWSRIWEDPELFDQVHRLAVGGNIPAGYSRRPPAPPRRGEPEMESGKVVGQFHKGSSGGAFGDELL